MSDFGDDILSITDDEGNEFDLLVLDEAMMNDVRYLALTESTDPEEDENLEVIILKVLEDDTLSTVDSEEELEKIYAIFEERMFSEDDYDEDDEEKA